MVLERLNLSMCASDSGSDDGTDNDLCIDNDNSITETIKLDILAFNDVPELPSTTIAMANGTGRQTSYLQPG